MPIKTTCIGAFPKPDYLPIKDWFKITPADDSYNDAVIKGWTDDAKHEALFERAIREAVQAWSCRAYVPVSQLI